LFYSGKNNRWTCPETPLICNCPDVFPFSSLTIIIVF
jgi:hypothetical protein